MRIRLLSAQEDGNYLRRAKTMVVSELGIDPAAVGAEVFDHRLYLGLYDQYSAALAGFMEADFYDQVFPDADHSPLANMPELTARCEFNEFAHLRTIYVEPSYRRATAAYSSLYLAMAVVLRRLGARFATTTTDSRNSGLIDLYRKTGGRYIAQYRSPPEPDHPQAVIVFSVQQTLQHRRTHRVASALDIDEPTLRVMRKRKAFTAGHWAAPVDLPSTQINPRQSNTGRRTMQTATTGSQRAAQS
jgi:hypothetical protein